MTHFVVLQHAAEMRRELETLSCHCNDRNHHPAWGLDELYEYRREAGVWHGGCTASFRKEAAAADTTPEKKSWIIMFAVLNSKHGLVSDSTPNTRKYKKRQYENHSEIVG